MLATNTNRSGGQYAQVSTEDTIESSTPVVAAAPSSLAAQDYDPSALRRSTFSHLPEARDLTWTDPYYDGKHGIVAAFDRDGDKAGDYYQGIFTRVAMVFASFAILYWIMAYADSQSSDPYLRKETGIDEFFGFYMAGFVLIFGLMGYKAKQEMKLQHVAISTEGIRVDNGSMMTITIALEHILSCEVVNRPTRRSFLATCCMGPPGFQTVRLQRTASPMEQTLCQKSRRVELLGIVKAQEFVTLLQAMKDAQDNGTYEGVARVELQSMSSV